MDTSVIIIGGGISGITLARELQKKGIDFLLFEADDRLGGRVKTDSIDGYQLDHGFQVLLTAYPEYKRWFAKDSLDLRSFSPSSRLLYSDGKQTELGDPTRDLSILASTLLSSSASFIDKLKIFNLKRRLMSMSLDQIFSQPNKPTVNTLREDYGFSRKVIDHFFMPFYTGIFLEDKLVTSRRMFDFVFKMFSESEIAVPNKGMEEIPKKLAEKLSVDAVHLNAKVDRLVGQTVFLEDGRTFSAPKLVLATEAIGFVKEFHSVKQDFHATTHVHFIANEPPFAKPQIALLCSKNRLVNNFCVINQIAPGYAPEGKYLISVTVIADHHSFPGSLDLAIKNELNIWFGNQVNDWEHLHTRKVAYALPDQKAVKHQINMESTKVREGLYICGDYLLNGSLNGAMKIGRDLAIYLSEQQDVRLNMKFA